MVTVGQSTASAVTDGATADSEADPEGAAEGDPLGAPHAASTRTRSPAASRAAKVGRDRPVIGLAS
jgi:hypothetical protein